MKIKTIRTIALLALSAALLTACGSAESGSEEKDTAAKTEAATAAETEAAAETEQAETEAAGQDDFGFVLPKDAVSPDISKDDPSDDSISFKYDDLGRVDSYTYQANGKKMVVGYIYDDEKSSVWILGYADEIVAVDETLELTGSFDASLGFTEHNGYFFKGYKF